MRLFVGAFPPADFVSSSRAALSDLRESVENSPGSRWVPSDHWHVTLAFLGDLDLLDLPRIETALAKVKRTLTSAGRTTTIADPKVLDSEPRILGKQVPRVFATPDELTGFPSVARARVAAVSLAGSNLIALGESIRGALAVQGFDLEDRPFRPHLTVARFRYPQKLPLVEATTQMLSIGLKWEINSMDLIESRPNDPQRRFQTLKQVDLVRGPFEE